MPYPAKTTIENILKEALVLLEQNASELSMRNLAKRLNIKAPSLYKYFADKDALELALVEKGSELLRLDLEKAVTKRNLKKTFQEVSKTYITFARQHPALYDLMMAKLSSPTGAGKALWNFVVSLVGEPTKKSDDTAAAVAFWSFLHGYSVLDRSGMFGASGPRGGLEVGLEAFLKGLSE
ncbi:MAG: TetR/AcrR family transcriptional regulator [Trueperaceae bacterium]